jgi:hypothetical protein
MAQRKRTPTVPQEQERPSDDPQVLRQVLRRAAEEQVQKRAEVLRQFPLPMAAEPAVRFTP